MISLYYNYFDISIIDLIFFLCYNDIIIIERGIVMAEQITKKLLAQKHTNSETGFLLRHIYGKTERFSEHTHDFYEIFLTINGNITHFVNGYTQTLEPGCLVFMRPDDVHRYIYRNEAEYEFVNLAIDSSIIDSVLRFLSEAADTDFLIKDKTPTVVRLTGSEMKSYLKKIDYFYTVDNSDIQQKKLRIRSFLTDTFIKYFLKKAPEDQSDMPLWLEETAERMKRKENFTVGIQRMTEISGKTQEHLARSVKKYYGVTLSEFINELRINYAVNLILNTNLKMTDICYESGFGNISNFYTNFKRIYNMSPKEFRINKGVSKYFTASGFTNKNL